MGKLSELIERLKKTPMNVGSLKRILPSYATFKTLDQISEHRSKVFGKHKCVVMLIPSKFSKMGHYVCLTRFPKYIEYFSSLGGNPSSEVAKLGQNGSNLMTLLGKNYAYNSKALQQNNTTIEDCALWVMCRLKLSGLKLREFQGLFTNKIHLRSPDDIMAMMVILFLTEL